MWGKSSCDRALGWWSGIEFHQCPNPPHCVHPVDEIWCKRCGGEGIDADNATDQKDIKRRKYVADQKAEMQVARSENDQVCQRVAKHHDDDQRQRCACEGRRQRAGE